MTGNVTISISLTSKEKNAVRAGTGFSWNKLESISDSHTVIIELGEYGWFEFAQGH